MSEGYEADGKTRKELVPGEKTRAEILGGQNFGFEIDTPERLDLARRVMEWQGLPQNQTGKGRHKLDRDCLHASLSWGDGQTPDRAEMIEAAQSFLKSIGLEKARAVFVAHDDTEHAHLHIIASRIDAETGRSLTMDNDFIHAQAWAARWERAHGQERDAAKGKRLHALMDAVDARDVAGVVSHLTRDKATFTAFDLNRALAYGDMTKDERAAFRADMVDDKQVVGLRETREGEVTRYTSREELKDEMRVMRDAAALENAKGHGIDGAEIDRIAEQFTLKPEQADAARHLTGEEGLSILWGEAGTGKSHTLKAVRTAYEEEGARVVGLSWTNKVVHDMRENGFEHSNTITRELNALRKGKTAWDENTVLMVDEAAMLSTKALGACPLSPGGPGFEAWIGGLVGLMLSAWPAIGRRGGSARREAGFRQIPPLSELQNVVGEAYEAPFGGNRLDAAQQELAEAARLLDLAEHRFGQLFPQPVRAGMAAGLDLLAHGGDAGAAAFSRAGVLGPSRRDIGVDFAFLQRREVGVGAIAGVG